PLDELLTEHLRQQFRARLAVAVLAGDRPAQAEDEVGGLVDKLAVGLDPLFRLQVEVPARVDASLAEVAVERALVAVLVRERADRPQVLAEPLRRDGRVLPALIGIRLARDERRRAEA